MVGTQRRGVLVIKESDRCALGGDLPPSMLLPLPHDYSDILRGQVNWLGQKILPLSSPPHYKL